MLYRWAVSLISSGRKADSGKKNLVSKISWFVWSWPCLKPTHRIFSNLCMLGDRNWCGETKISRQPQAVWMLPRTILWRLWCCKWSRTVGKFSIGKTEDCTAAGSQFRYFSAWQTKAKSKRRTWTFHERTKLSEWSSWKVRRLAQLRSCECVFRDRPTRSFRLRIVSGTNVDLHVRRTN